MHPISIRNHSVLAQWDYSGTQILAIKKGHKISFKMQGEQALISELALRNIRGWILPENVEWQFDLKSFYQRFKPVILEGSEMILSLVDYYVVNEETKKIVRIVVFIEKQEPQLRILSDRNIYAIPFANIQGGAREAFRPVKGKITQEVIKRIVKIAELEITAINLKKNSLYAASKRHTNFY